ncbi:hedgehog-interacting protein [Diretmus argenteus]
MKHLQFVLVLAIAVNVWECGDAKFGERGEMSPRRRRCYDGSMPKRLKKRERKVLLDGGSSGEVCHRLYPRVSCCPTRRAAYQILHRRDARIFSTNNTECGHLLEEIKCARCSPNAQVLFHSLDMDKMPHREPDLPRLCQDFCREFYYTCRGHIPELFQADVDEFCQYYGRRDGSPCFPDFQRKQPRGQDSNYLGDEKIEDISRKQKHNCYCAQEVLTGLRQPVAVVNCGDGSQRLFVLEREGIVRILTHELELLKEPFLDIHKLVQSGLKGGDERGLLSLAFHPNYKKNGKLYVSYTTNQERWAIGPHDHILRVVEYTISRKNPNQVDTRTVRVLMEVAELHRKHLGGQLLFGPDGLLHIVLGDGMITLDDMEEMDGLSDFTGSVLRVDVDTDCCASPYSIPRNNPYFNSTNQPPEIFAHGLHDPGRCAVDRHQMDNGSLLILCTDASGKNTSAGRILEIVKGKDYGEFQVVRVSSQTGEGVPELWARMESYRDAMLASGDLQRRRRDQQKVWMWSLIQENVLRHFQNHPAVGQALPHLEDSVTSGAISPGLAADLLLKAFSSSSSSSELCQDTTAHFVLLDKWCGSERVNSGRWADFSANRTGPYRTAGLATVDQPAFWHIEEEQEEL